MILEAMGPFCQEDISGVQLWFSVYVLIML